MKSIINPIQKTYFICRNGSEITAYGSVDSNQTMNTGQPIVETYLQESEWEAKLLEAGIELEDEEIEV